MQGYLSSPLKANYTHDAHRCSQGKILPCGLFYRFPQLRFEYRDPERNFDRSKVYGPVASLVQVKDVKTATALEVSAGGKVRNVAKFSVVSTSDVIVWWQLSKVAKISCRRHQTFCPPVNQTVRKLLVRWFVILRDLDPDKRPGFWRLMHVNSGVSVVQHRGGYWTDGQETTAAWRNEETCDNYSAQQSYLRDNCTWQSKEGWATGKHWCCHPLAALKEKAFHWTLEQGCDFSQ